MKTLNERTNDALAWIDAQLAICKAATDGPWIAEGNWIGKGNSGIATTCHYSHDSDAAFIAASRIGYPAMLELIKVSIVELLEISKRPSGDIPDESCVIINSYADDAESTLATLLNKIQSLQCE